MKSTMRRSILAVTILFPLVAAAHGKADNHLQIMVVDDRIRMSMVVDMRVLRQVDEDRDGYASLAELSQHREQLQDWIRQTLIVTDASGVAGEVVFADITSDLNIAGEHGDRVDHARILQTLEFPNALRSLHVDLRQLASRVPELSVSIIDAKSGMRYRPGEAGKAQIVTLPAASAG